MKEIRIIQLIKSVTGNERKTINIFPFDCEYSAQARFNELVRMYPLEYFEMFMLEHKEECMAFTEGRNLDLPHTDLPALLARCKTALQLASEHLTEMAKCPIYHPIGKCPVLDSINKTLADLEKAGVK